MNKERWNQVDELYHAALEREPEARTGFLAQACVGDEDLQREVEGLLAYDQRAASFIEIGAVDLEAKAMADPRTEESGLESKSSPHPYQIGPYKLISPLGKGGMGDVYLAYDSGLDRKAAIKFLRAEFSAENDRVGRFEREARAASALNHPNIITIYETGVLGDRRYLVTEFVEGETLRRRMDDAPQKRVKPREGLEIAAQVADALQAAHAAGIIHRDIKPENVVVRNDGLVKLLDFGLAKLSREKSESEPAASLTQSGLVMGTLSYMSPEQAGGQTVDYRTDIFSLGVMLYEMLAGRRAFEGESRTDVLAGILTTDPEPLGQVVPEVTTGLERIVQRCLEKKPEKRFQSAGDLSFALKALTLSSDWRVGRPAGSRGAEGTTRISGLWRSLGRGGTGWIAALLALVVAIMVLIFPNRSPRETGAVRFSVAPPEKTDLLDPRSFAISPDGRNLVFAPRDLLGKRQLWVRALDSLSAQPLPGTEGALAPFWSPDSRSIAFFALGKLKRVEAAGGAVSTICEAKGEGFINGTWNREGLILFEQRYEIYRVSDSGGEATRLIALDEGRQEIAVRQPRFLPDDRHFLYSIRSHQAENNGVYVGSLEEPRGKMLVRADTNAGYSQGYLLFLRQATLMAQSFNADRQQLTGEPITIAERLIWPIEFPAPVSSSDNGVLAYLNPPSAFSMVWFDRSGKKLGTVGQPAVYSNPALSPDGKRLAVDIRDPRTGSRDIWLFELTTGISSRFTFDPADDFGAVWSPDGNRIAFTSDRRGHRDLYQRMTNGAGEDEILLESPDFKNVEDWSPDGRSLIYNVRDPMSVEDLWILPLEGERKPTVFLDTPQVEHQSQFSPNGRWLAYVSTEPGRYEVLIQAFPHGGKWQISTDEGQQPKWRGDGKELFYIAGNQEFKAVDLNATSGSLDVGTTHSLFETSLPVGGRNWYAVSADGQRFLVRVPAEGGDSGSLIVTLNWPATAPKR